MHVLFRFSNTISVFERFDSILHTHRSEWLAWRCSWAGAREGSPRWKVGVKEGNSHREDGGEGRRRRRRRGKTGASEPMQARIALRPPGSYRPHRCKDAGAWLGGARLAGGGRGEGRCCELSTSERVTSAHGVTTSSVSIGVHNQDA